MPAYDFNLLPRDDLDMDSENENEQRNKEASSTVRTKGAMSQIPKDSAVATNIKKSSTAAKAVASTKNAATTVETDGYQTIEERIAEQGIKYHPAIRYDNTVMTITLDFTPPVEQYQSDEFGIWRTALVETLPKYHKVTSKITILIYLPHHSQQSFSLVRLQHEIIQRVVGEIATWTSFDVRKIDVVMKAPSEHWHQIQGLSCLYALNGKNWDCKIESKSRDKDGKVIDVVTKLGGPGSEEWVRRLRGRYREASRVEWHN